MSNIDLIARAVEESEKRTPQVVIDSFAPENRLIFGRELLPLTLGHCLALEKLEIPVLRGEVDSVDVLALAIEVMSSNSWEALELASRRQEDELAVRAAILAGEVGEATREDAQKASELVHEHVSAAFRPALPLRSPHRGTPRRDPGFGWWLTTYAAACERMSAEQAMHEVPLAQVFAMNASAACASGLEPSGATYVSLEFDRVFDLLTREEDQADG